MQPPGLEPVLIDYGHMALTALEPDDPRTFQIRVAGITEGARFPMDTRDAGPGATALPPSHWGGGPGSPVGAAVLLAGRLEGGAQVGGGAVPEDVPLPEQLLKVVPADLDLLSPGTLLGRRAKPGPRSESPSCHQRWANRRESHRLSLLVVVICRSVVKSVQNVRF